ncbi:mannitol dehydrogenase family protein [Bosea sp. (in: a-proteobacteria)]|uniref:mannitol dehydrogenase family protein n=1 Tax=Bosea sp. (in: a-proteobacteria) TaxID=1871050 RepID=UPI00122BD307|nr:mannitol dehydrogenase family protein [Bosea sp. (in: a-proteobacteria)]TAJ28749.1 MAG: mannitol dehydrogenase family protein [Bosea sp. (in: a-proteobacteria)]
MTRLSNATLGQLSPAVRRPAYDRTALKPGIVHLGLGAFARGHLADYTEDALERRFGAWGITGASLQRPDQRDRLKPQDGLYTLLKLAPTGPELRVIGSVLDVLVAPESPAALIARLAAPDTRIVSLTVTEKGYCHDPATGKLKADHPDIVHDLANPQAPRSAVGILVAGLKARRDAGLGPFTALCCDNLPANGHVLRGLVRDFAALQDDTLATWIEANGAFPATMVDRIVPATTDADIAEVARLTGLEDAAPVIGEPFRQWAIEDIFAAGRPDWHEVGAQMVTDVAPFEFMKLRMLNGAHSSLAYLGYLAGHETVAEASGDAILARFLEGLWAEIIPTVPAPQGVVLADYARALLTRFQNPAIRHRTWQIAMDGSQKLPQRLLGTIRERLKAGAPIDHLALGVAAWMRYVSGTDEKGAAIDVRDPLAAEFRRRADAAGRHAQALSESLLGIEAIFGADLPGEQRFTKPVSAHLAALFDKGAKAAAASLG